MKPDQITTEKFLPVLREIKEDENIKAVVLRVNSPGGSVQPAEQIRKEIELIGETRPVIVSYGTVAASGGYWISAGADKIFCNNNTLTGSIGVFSMIPTFGNTLKKIAHINPVSITSHPHADMLSMMRKLDKQEVTAMQAQVELIYEKFIKIVSQGREMSIEDVDKVGQGRVWCGIDAINIHLVDEIGGIKDALDYAAVAADLSDYRIVEYPTVKNPLQKAMESVNSTAKALETMSEPEKIIYNIYDNIKANGGIFARMPFNLIID